MKKLATAGVLLILASVVMMTPSTRADIDLGGGGGRGAISWPLLAPNSSQSAPSYSFSNFPGSGIWNTGGVVIQGQDGSGTDQAGLGAVVRAGSGTGTGVGGDVRINVSPPDGSSGSTPNTPQNALLVRGNTGSIELGGIGLETPGDSFFLGADVISGVTDGDGGDIYIDAGLGTGAGAPGVLVFRTPATLGSGSTQQSVAARLTIDEDLVTFATSILYEDTFWDDLRVSLNATRVTGVSEPTWAQFMDDGAGSDGVYAYQWPATGTKNAWFDVQMPHAWKEGTDIEPHVHWASAGTDNGTVRWTLEYTWANVNSTFGNTSTVNMDDTGSGTAKDHLIAPAASAITGTGKTLSSVLMCRLTRDNSVGDNLTDAAWALSVDFHYEIDAPGSSEEYTK